MIQEHSEKFWREPLLRTTANKWRFRQCYDTECRIDSKNPSVTIRNLHKPGKSFEAVMSECQDKKKLNIFKAKLLLTLWTILFALQIQATCTNILPNSKCLKVPKAAYSEYLSMLLTCQY